MNNSNRIGMGIGKGRGYKNLTHYDSYVHCLSGKGIRTYQPIFNKFPLGHNPLELTLYVPSTTKDTKGKDRAVSTQKFLDRIKDAQKEMSNLFGGYTRVDAKGGWYNKDKNELVQEDVATVTSFTTIKDFDDNKKKFEDYVEKIRKEYKQDEMSIEFEGDLYFYKPTIDTDGDGVNDLNDCNPFNPNEQDLASDTKMQLDKLKWYIQWNINPNPFTTMTLDTFYRQMAKYPVKVDKDKDGIPDDFDFDIKKKKRNKNWRLRL